MQFVKHTKPSNRYLFPLITSFPYGCAYNIIYVFWCALVFCQLAGGHILVFHKHIRTKQLNNLNINMYSFDFKYWYSVFNNTKKTGQSADITWWLVIWCLSITFCCPSTQYVSFNLSTTNIFSLLAHAMCLRIYATCLIISLFKTGLGFYLCPGFKSYLPTECK